MSYTKTYHTFLSSNQKNIITYYVYTPCNTPKAILQISHGMCEYLERYEPFIEFLIEHDILVCGNDHLGHGHSIQPDGIKGFFGEHDGWKYLPMDLAKVTKRLKKQYPNTPYYLFGHSMGSFVARLYLSKYSNFIDGAIISGTSGTNYLAPLGAKMIQIIKKYKGGLYRSDSIQKLLFGAYNKHYENVKTDFDWLSRDEAVVDNYQKDPDCNFIFTTSAFSDLIKMLLLISSNRWYQSIPHTMPLFIMSGTMDPLGNYGKGIQEVYMKLQKQGIKDINIKLYDNYRHELLNELEKEHVYQDLLEWILNHIS